MQIFATRSNESRQICQQERMSVDKFLLELMSIEQRLQELMSVGKIVARTNVNRTIITKPNLSR